MLELARADEREGEVLREGESTCIKKTINNTWENGCKQMILKKGSKI